MHSPKRNAEVTGVGSRSSGKTYNDQPKYKEVNKMIYTRQQHVEGRGRYNSFMQMFTS